MEFINCKAIAEKWKSEIKATAPYESNTFAE